MTPGQEGVQLHCTHLCASNVHASCHESVFCLLHIINLQNVSTSKLDFIKRLTMLKEIHRETDSGGFHSCFSGFLLAYWLHNTEGPVNGNSFKLDFIFGQQVLQLESKCD